MHSLEDWKPFQSFWQENLPDKLSRSSFPWRSSSIRCGKFWNGWEWKCRKKLFCNRRTWNKIRNFSEYLTTTITCAIKGGLILESFSLWLKLTNKGCQITLLSTLHKRVLNCLGEWFGTLFGDLIQNEYFSEIMPTLSTYVPEVLECHWKPPDLIPSICCGTNPNIVILDKQKTLNYLILLFDY